MPDHQQGGRGRFLRLAACPTEATCALNTLVTAVPAPPAAPPTADTKRSTLGQGSAEPISPPKCPK